MRLANDYCLAFWARRDLPGEEGNDPHDCYQRWASLNIFLALGYVRLNEPLRLPVYGISITCEPLEEEPWKYSHSRILADEEKKLWHEHSSGNLQSDPIHER